MSEFNRGLSEEFVEALNDEYSKKDSWWRPFVDDDELFLAIRRKYVNVYHCGGSILRLKRPYGRQFKGEVHHKYLGKKKPRSGYYVPVTKDDLHCLRVADLKERAREHAGDEKTDVHEILCANRERILDVEINIPGSGSQVDFAMIFDGCLRFCEAKSGKRPISDSGLATQKPTPPVVDQIRRYAEWIEDSRQSIEDSYKSVTSNLTKIDGVRDRHPERHKLLKAVSGKLHIDPCPWLVITSTECITNSNWSKHLDKLKRKLEDRVICLGGSGWEIP